MTLWWFLLKPFVVDSSTRPHKTLGHQTELKRLRMTPNRDVSAATAAVLKACGLKLRHRRAAGSWGDVEGNPASSLTGAQYCKSRRTKEHILQMG